MKKNSKKVTARPPRKKGARKRRDSAVDELLPEYDAALIRSGTRGKYAAAYAEGTNVIVLDPDVAAEFPNATAVNGALRELAKIIRDHRRPLPTDSSRRTA